MTPETTTQEIDAELSTLRADLEEHRRDIAEIEASGKVDAKSAAELGKVRDAVEIKTRRVAALEAERPRAELRRLHEAFIVADAVLTQAALAIDAAKKETEKRLSELLHPRVLDEAVRGSFPVMEAEHKFSLSLQAQRDALRAISEHSKEHRLVAYRTELEARRWNQ